MTLRTRHGVWALLLGAAACSPPAISPPDQHPPPAATPSSPVTPAPGAGNRESVPPPSPSPAAQEWWSRSDLDRKEVARWREYFLGKGRRGLERWLAQGAPYAADVQRELRDEGLPPEFWVLPLLESGYRLHARSSARAVGPWQFVPETARHVGLLVTTDRDQRRDWVASTRGACRYLREMRDDLGDGLLALAGYNCGPARVRREMASKKSTDFWDLHLPPETRDYVPRLLALVSLVGTGVSLDGAPPPGPVPCDTVEIPAPVKVADLARAGGIAPDRLRELNPAWLLPATPGDGHPVRARVPAGAGDRVKESIGRGEVPPFRLSPDRVHRVKKGETLWGIAHRYGVVLRDLLDLNGIRERDVLRPGRLLRLPG